MLISEQYGNGTVGIPSQHQTAQIPSTTMPIWLHFPSVLALLPCRQSWFQQCIEPFADGGVQELPLPLPLPYRFPFYRPVACCFLSLPIFLPLPLPQQAHGPEAKHVSDEMPILR